MSFYLELQKATEIKRASDGSAYTWRKVRVIETFKTASEYLEYVQVHIQELKHAVAFSGSAGLSASANMYLADQLKKAEVL